MRIHGVTPEFIRDLRALGYKDLSVDDLVKLRIHGAQSPSFERCASSGTRTWRSTTW